MRCRFFFRNPGDCFVDEDEGFIGFAMENNRFSLPDNIGQWLANEVIIIQALPETLRLVDADIFVLKLLYSGTLYLFQVMFAINCIV